MPTFIMPLRRSVTAFCDDTSGFILPYVTVLMVVFIGLGALALDGGRYMSTQTQMQAIADALALSGARELDTLSGARARATSAIDNLVSNGLTGMDYSGAITHATPIFYSALPVATAGFTGTAATSDLDARFVAVTVNPVTVPTMLPIGLNNFSTGAQAIAGFTSRTYCDIPPVFICNPYETSGMTDSQATSALQTNLALASVRRQQIRLDPTKSGPGQFGYLVPPDGCNGASCLEDWIAQANPKTCYQTASVDLNTGFKNSVTDGFNVRFDIYAGNLKQHKGDALYAPALNVRKGYTTGTGTNWCNANPANPYLNSAPRVTPAVYPNVTTPTSVGDFSAAGNSNCNSNGNNPCVVKNVPLAIVTQIKAWLASSPVTVLSGTLVTAGTTVTAGCLAADLSVNPCKAVGAPANSLIMSAPAIGTQSAAPMVVGLQTSGLPMDTSLAAAGNTSTFGNGQWDCESYWRINHAGAAPPANMDNLGGVCSNAANTTVSRYAVYLYENQDNTRISQYSLPGIDNKGGENGSPHCNGSGVGPSANQTDRRVIFSAVINCLAHSDIITGGQTANNIPVAGFGKFFMSQPVGADGTSYIYGEMSGLVGSLDQVRMLNQVQLYR